MTEQSTTTSKSNRRGLPGTLVSFEIRTNKKGGEFGYGKLSYNSSGKTLTTTVMVPQNSESQKAAFADLRATAAGSKVDLFGEFKDVVVEGKKVGRFFDVVKSGGRPVRAPKAAATA